MTGGQLAVLLVWLALCATLSLRCKTAISGENVLLDCLSAQQYMTRLKQPLSRLHWQLDGAIIASYSVTNGSAEWWVADSRLELNRGDFSLKIYSLQSHDSGQYQCVSAITAYKPQDGRQLASTQPDSIELIVMGPPSAPTGVVVAAVTSRTATISWNEASSPPETPVIQYIIVTKIADTDGKMSALKEVFVPGNTTTATVPSLSPYTKYSFDMRAENIAGRSKPSRATDVIHTTGEAPSAPPTIKHVFNTSDTSIEITWNHPPANTLNGPLVGYRITARGMVADTPRRMYYVPTSDITSYELRNLSTYTRYMVTLEVDNDMGFSPPATTMFLTDEGIPESGPVITRLSALSSDSFEIIWIPPEVQNGVVLYYTLYYQHDEELSVKKLAHNRHRRSTNPVNSYVVRDLDPYTKYVVWLTCSTSKGESPPSDKGNVHTDTAASSPPMWGNVTFDEFAARPFVRIEWLPPARVYRSVDLYVLTVTADGSTMKFNYTYTEPYHHIVLPDKGSAQTQYKLSVVAATNSIVQPKQRYLSASSTVEYVTVQTSTSPARISTSICPPWATGLAEPRTFQNVRLCTSLGRMQSVQPLNSPTVTASVICLLIAALFGFATLLIVCRRRWRPAFAKLQQSSPLNGGRCVSVEVSTSQAAVEEELYFTYDDTDYPQLKASDFPEHVRTLHLDANIGFSREYESLVHASGLLEDNMKKCSEALLPNNRAKNRYVNIVPYDQSRVKLHCDNSEADADYINANYVDGFNRLRAYIATQGPLPTTFVDFWQMVWEQHVTVVVMITNVVEHGRAEDYGPYSVKLLSEHETAFFTRRTLSVKQNHCSSIRIVSHFHYTHWPDHGVPEDVAPVLRFVRESGDIARQTDANAPVVVHCSAGVGRSGTYIVLDSMLQQCAARHTINVYAYLKHIRRQRNYLVQTEEQYIFCHDALLEAIYGVGRTDIAANQLSSYIEGELVEMTPRKPFNLLQQQYQLVCRKPPLIESQCEVAQRPEHINKHRSLDYQALDRYRVPFIGNSSSTNDYINAVFLPGYFRQDEFILAQHPLDPWLCDVWSVIWEHNCQTVVVLSEIDNKFKPFWPMDELCDLWSAQLNIQGFSVEVVGCSTLEDATCVDFVLQTASDDFQLPLRLIHYPSWPTVCQPLSPSVFDLVNSVRTAQNVYYQNGPVMVVDSFGSTNAATFCALYTLACQFEHESITDVYEVARLISVRRPGVFASCDDFYFLYRAVKLLHLCDDQANLFPPHPFGANTAAIAASKSLPANMSVHQKEKISNGHCTMVTSGHA